jgi:phosphatidylserine/phosphatidylglycerophosphate/cardiolipin synthase-like enzyme
MQVLTLTDGGQSAGSVASWITAFLREAAHSLDLALYDLRLPGAIGDRLAEELRAAERRGVEVRLAYNVECGRPPQIHPPPSTRPELLEQLPIATKAIPGVPDLMHHKYAVRDGVATLTGSANWTLDSWTRQENVMAIVEDEAVAGAYRANFEELWRTRDVDKSGRQTLRFAEVDGASVRAWFTPGQGDELSQQIATAIGRAGRVRVASPVITSAPVLGTLAEAAGRGRDVAGVVDAPQTRTVFEQWRENGHSAWKIPLLAAVLSRLPFTGKPSIPWREGSDSPHNFMHAKVCVADDVSFFGSFNLSRSGEQNAENVLEVHNSALAERLARFVEEVAALYPAPEIPSQARATISSG